MNLHAYLEERRAVVDDVLRRLLPTADGPAATVSQAMHYAVFGGGKRLRPILVIASSEACGSPPDTVLAPAAAMEMIHTYSLIHDDLPALDNDDLRRGRATTHKEFGEAEAILAGDGLLTLALEVLASEPFGDEPAPRRAEAVALVTRAAGISGMVGGQMADLEAERKPVEQDRLEWIHRHKTGALLAASTELGALHASCPPLVREAMAKYGLALGLAFQVTDDILDVTSTAETLGKTPGKDARSGKATYPALFGLDSSHREAERLVSAALKELQAVDGDCTVLEALARYVLERTH